MFKHALASPHVRVGRLCKATASAPDAPDISIEVVDLNTAKVRWWSEKGKMSGTEFYVNYTRTGLCFFLFLAALFIERYVEPAFRDE